MRICIIGKYPPIQGGVSMRTYLAAHALAARGHEVHVVTNAREAAPPFRMHMRREDWRRCEPSFDVGSVKVHWSDPPDRSQAYLPMASPFVSKLATLAARAHATQPFGVIYSHYLEPYGVAGHLAAQITGAPHVVRMAGSDAGRLWHHPQLEALYDHVLRSATTVVAAGKVAERAIERGIPRDRIVAGGGYALPQDVFTPQGPKLDLQALRQEVEGTPLADMLWGGLAPGRPYFGVYGKLGKTKGTFALIEALHRIAKDGVDVGLVALAHGQPEAQRQFRARVQELGLADRVLQLPFLPHWRVPELLRSCLAVCCLEQDFPIGFHSPIIPLEVMLCGTCLISSIELVRKLPGHERLPSGWGWIAIDDVNDVRALSNALAAVAREPSLAAAVGGRGRRFARAAQSDVGFPEILEAILTTTSTRGHQRRRRAPPTSPRDRKADERQFPLTFLVAQALAGLRGDTAHLDRAGDDLAFARRTLAEAEQAVAAGTKRFRPLAQAVQVEIAVATAQAEHLVADTDERSGPPARPVVRDHDRGDMVPVRDPHMQVLEFPFDAGAFRGIDSVRGFPATIGPGPSYLAVFRDCDSRGPLLIDPQTARICALSDGTRSIADIVNELNQKGYRNDPLDYPAWFEDLALRGLLTLRSIT